MLSKPHHQHDPYLLTFSGHLLYEVKCEYGREALFALPVHHPVKQTLGQNI